MSYPSQFGMMFYKGTRPGFPGLYNRIVRIWDSGRYSHVEVTFSDGFSASSSFQDGGVRFKMIEFDSLKWDFVPLPPHMEPFARDYFMKRAGKVGYDLRGNFHFVIGTIQHDRGKEFCSESGAGCLDLIDPWRYTPNSLASVAVRIWEQYQTSLKRAA